MFTPPQYVSKLKTGTLSAREELEMEIPYSPELVRAFWLAAGGSILAADHALKNRIAFNIGGGFHHAFPDHGEGFCMIHDVAVAIRRMQRDDRITRAMTVDCDVHQGNGTAAIFAGTRVPTGPLPSTSASTLTPAAPAKMRNAHAGDVFTISLHQENNYPMWKPPSSIDVDLPDEIGDDDYLAWLDNALSSGLRQFDPELICYIAGADPYREDQLGGLSLTMEGLKRRDELVFRVARARSDPGDGDLRGRLCQTGRRYRDDPLQHGPGCERNLCRLLRFHGGRFWRSFDGDIDLGALLQAHFIPVLVSQIIFDTQFFVQVIGPFHSNLRLFRLAGVRRLDDLLDSSGQGSTWLLGHGLSFGVRNAFSIV